MVRRSSKKTSKLETPETQLNDNLPWQTRPFEALETKRQNGIMLTGLAINRGSIVKETIW
jgi:hypothetical protein